MGKKVLIVDDNVINVQLSQECLQLGGYGTIAASSGEDAIHLADRFQPDLILMDIHLPDMSGFEASRTIKTRGSTRHIPILAVTAQSVLEREQLELGGMDGCLYKPYQVRALLEKVRAYMGSVDRQAGWQDTAREAIRGMGDMRQGVAQTC